MDEISKSSPKCHIAGFYIVTRPSKLVSFANVNTRISICVTIVTRCHKCDAVCHNCDAVCHNCDTFFVKMLELGSEIIPKN